MPGYYPDPNITTSQGVLEYPNSITNGLLMNLFLVATAIIIFSIMKNRGEKTSLSFLVANFSALILGSLIWALGLIQGKMMMVFLLLSLGSLIWVMFDTK